MVLPSKTRLSKRKLEIKEVRKEKQITTSRKHDKKCFETMETASKEEISAPRRPQTKADLLDKMESMKELNDALLEEVKSNEEAITNLEGKEKMYIESIKSLEEKIEKLRMETSRKSNCDLKTQTSLDPGDLDLQIPCRICIYVATCEEQLNWHMDDEHNIQTDMFYETDFPCEICAKWCRTEADLTYHIKKHEFDNLPSESNNENALLPSTVKQYSRENLTCNFCKEKFTSRGALMHHKKNNHEDNVAICWKYSTGNCTFSNDDCWFLHCESEQYTSEWKCSLCESKFICQSEFLRHRKHEHRNLVQMCRNVQDGTCIFGSLNCWFIHDDKEAALESEKTILTEHNEVIEKVFGMMEKMTERILMIEKSI